MARWGRILLVGAAVAAGIGGAVRAQQQLEDPKNAAKIFAGTCSACHKTPQGLAKGGNTAGFLREHYTTGPEMSNAMAAYLAAAGNGPAPSAKRVEKQAEKQKEAVLPPQKQHVTTATPTPAAEPPSLRGKTKGAAAKGIESPPMPPERPAPPSATAALNTPAARASEALPAAQPLTLDLPPPDYPAEPPADLREPSAFSSAPLP